MNELSRMAIKCLAALSPYMQIASCLFLSLAIYSIAKSRRFFAVLRNGRSRKYIICGLLSINVAIFYALIATNKPTVFITSVIHMSIWILSLGLTRAFGGGS